MDSDVIQAKPDFRLRIMLLLLRTDWLARYGTILRPEYFPTKDEIAFVKFLNKHYDKYSRVPSDVSLRQGLDGNSLLDELLTLDDDDLDFAADTAMDFAKIQSMKLAVLAGVDDIRDGKPELILGRVKEALKVGSDKLDLGLDLVDDVDIWVNEELHGKRYPTGWITVDKLLGGGLVAGEYGLLMAPPGMGKTTGLVNIGYAMAGLMGSANVLHVSLEIPKEQVLARYAARIAGVRLNRDDDQMSEQAFKDALCKRAKQTLRGRLRVVDGQYSVSDIDGLIDRLDAEGFHTGALIVDYPDLVVPDRHRNEARFELQDIARALRVLGQAHGIPVWGATQATRDSLYKENVTIASIAEDIGKAAIADFIIAVCQTHEEEELNQARLFLAKIRRAKGHIPIPVRIDFENQAIVESKRAKQV